MRRADLVIFDCDGTLVDTETASNRVLAEILTEYGAPLTGEESQARFCGYSLAAIAEELSYRGIILPGDWAEQYYARCLPVLAEEARAMPGALETVEALEALRIASCVASQGPVAKMRLTLGRTGLWPRFEGRVFSAYMVKRGKPWPDLFLHAATQMRTGFDRCVVVEDSLTGVKAAVAAGMRCLALATGAEARAMAALGAEPIESLMDVPDAVAG
jgi:HAD superfamily hydrolase (TIGR01509 family)